MGDIISVDFERRNVSGPLLVASLFNLVRSLKVPKGSKITFHLSKKGDTRELYRSLLEDIFRVLASGPLIHGSAALIQEFFAFHLKESPLQFLATFWTSEGLILFVLFLFLLFFFFFFFFFLLSFLLFSFTGTITICLERFLLEIDKLDANIEEIFSSLNNLFLLPSFGK